MFKLVTQPRFKPLKPRVFDSSKSPFIDDCWDSSASPIHRCCWSNPNRLGIGFYCIPILLGKNFNKKSRKHIWNGPHKMEVRQFHWWSTFWTCLFTLWLHHPRSSKHRFFIQQIQALLVTSHGLAVESLPLMVQVASPLVTDELPVFKEG